MPEDSNMNDLSKSISELGGWKWRGPIPTLEDSSYEEFQYYSLHSKPLKDYSLEDIYFMIGQETSLNILVPIAVEHLSLDLLVETDDYPGDLLQRIIKLPSTFWQKCPDVKHKLILLLHNFENDLERLEDDWPIRKMLRQLIIEFIGC